MLWPKATSKIKTWKKPGIRSLSLALTLVTLTLLSPGYAEEVTVLRDVTYCTGGGEALKMDIYPPKPAAKPAPVVLFIHGGGWEAGSKRNGWGGNWAQRGYLFASIDYRLAPKYAFPAMIEDAKCAVRYLRGHATQYALDPNRIAVWGNSAGAHLAALLGLTGPKAGFEGTGGWPGVSSKVQAVVDMFGPADLLDTRGAEMEHAVLKTFGGDPANLRHASPLNWVHADAPPFLILHGHSDGVVPFRQSQALYQGLHELGVNARLIEVEGGHGFDEKSRPSAEELDRLIEAFVDRVLGQDKDLSR